MSTRNWIAVGLTIVSMVLIIPGLRSDALTITATIPLLKKPLYEDRFLSLWIDLHRAWEAIARHQPLNAIGKRTLDRFQLYADLERGPHSDGDRFAMEVAVVGRFEGVTERVSEIQVSPNARFLFVSLHYRGF